jgi:arsenate reductase
MSKPLSLIVLLVSLSAQAQIKSSKTVLFVCEHGSAKSIVAASHFTKLAKSAGLNVNVLSRGTNPDKAIPAKINEYLSQDDLPQYRNAPEQLKRSDIKAADYVVTFLPLPDSIDQSNVQLWRVPSFESGYPVARDSIINHIHRMIKEIKSDNQK